MLTPLHKQRQAKGV